MIENIILTGKNLAEIEKQFINLSDMLTDWVNNNGLLLNIKKTNYMLFSKQRKIIGIENFTPKISCRPIERQNVARFLGVLIDEKLTWSHHITAIKSKMARYIGIFYKLKSQLPLAAHLNLFQAHVQCHLNYCSLIWGFSANKNIESIFATQKKAMRAVMPGYVNYFYKDGLLPTHTKAAFAAYCIPTVHNIILKNALLFTLKAKNFQLFLPNSVHQLIPENSPTASSNYDDDSIVTWMEYYNNPHYRASIFYKGPLFYAEIINLLKPLNINSIYSYKKSITEYLNNLQSAGEDDDWTAENFKLYNPKGLRQSERKIN